MQKAIFSKTNLNDIDSSLAQSYLSCVQDLIQVDDVLELKEYKQHMQTSRFQHSLNVSYYAFLSARRLHLDERSAARAGLLHDLYYYDWRTKEDRGFDGRHCSVHPQVALENARNVTTLNAIEEDAIVNHMWPMSLHMPKTREGWLIQAVDKYCALSEVLMQSGRKVKYSSAGLSMISIASALFTLK